MIRGGGHGEAMSEQSGQKPMAHSGLRVLCGQDKCVWPTRVREYHVGRGSGHGFLRSLAPVWSGQVDMARSGLRVLRSMHPMAPGDTVTIQLSCFS